MAYDYHSKELVKKRLDSKLEKLRIDLAKLYSFYATKKNFQVSKTRDFRLFTFAQLDAKDRRNMWDMITFRFEKDKFIIEVEGKQNLVDAKERIEIKEESLQSDTALQAIYDAMNYVKALSNKEESYDDVLKNVVQYVKKHLI